MPTPTVIHADCIAAMAAMPADSIDAIVTDPPYGLEFMGKGWDKFDTYAGGNPAMKPQGEAIAATVDGEWQPGRTYGGRTKNPRCTRCGKLKRGNGACKCPDPRWDTRTAESAFQFQVFSEDWAREALRVLKPGGHLLAFGGTRTWHRLAVAIEDAGFELRDSIAWLYGSGFPKSLDVSKAIDKAAGATREVVGKVAHPAGNKPGGASLNMSVVGMPETADITAPATSEAAAWQGWGTALKPAFEPIVVARKPLAGTVAANVLEYGTGALNIDASRVGTDVVTQHGRKSTEGSSYVLSPEPAGRSWAGRWPANVILDESQAAALDGQSGTTKSTKGKPRGSAAPGDGWGMTATGSEYDDQGGASRFFYVAKAPKRERPVVDGVAHPTVKPLALMRYLVRLVTPPSGVVLDPFAGSGATIEAALLEGFDVIGIEREADYLPLIDARIARVPRG